MPVEVIVDPRATIRFLNGMERQLPFAVANALNAGANAVQRREQQEVETRFVLRTDSSRRFLTNMIMRRRGEDWANKAKLQAIVRIQAPASKSSIRTETGTSVGAETLLTRHIVGGTHSKPGGPLTSFFIPADATRPSRTTVVPRSLYPKSLGLADYRTPTGYREARRTIKQDLKRGTSSVQWKGKKRTFILTEKGTRGQGRALGIYQREGPHDIQLLWLFSKRITIRPTFRFYEIATQQFKDRWPGLMRQEWMRAIATARA